MLSSSLSGLFLAALDPAASPLPQVAPASSLPHDELLVLALLGSFAVLLTAHVALVGGFLRRRLWLRALVALPVPPLAPYWGARAGMHVRVVAWVTSAIAYCVLRVLARL